MEKFKGPCKDINPIFQDYKKSRGYLYNNIFSYYELDNFLYKNNIYNFNDSKKIFELVINSDNETKKRNRYFCLKELYDFMKILGYNDLYFIYIAFDKKENNSITLLSQEEINLFFKKIDNNSKLLKGNEKYISPTLFRLLYSTGMRIGEALSLNLLDFSRDEGTITIIRGKRNVTRKIPLSSSMLSVLIKYLKLAKPKDYVFELNNKPIKYNKVSLFFHNSIVGMKKFRIHDLRHNFAVNVFNSLYLKKYKEKQILYLLYIYMGHTKIESTEYYLRLTNENLKRIISLPQKAYSNIIPKIDDNNE